MNRTRIIATLVAFVILLAFGYAFRVEAPSAEPSGKIEELEPEQKEITLTHREQIYLGAL